MAFPVTMQRPRPRPRRGTPVPRVAAVAAAAATVVLVATAFATLCAAQASNNSWRSLPAGEIPAGGREETALAACGDGLLCLIGGRSVKPVAIYNTISGTWSSGAPPPLEIHHFQATTGPDGCVWVGGAFTGGYPNEDNVGALYTYCAATDTWAPVPGGKEPRPRGAAGSVWHDGKLYIVTGNVGGHGPQSAVQDAVDVFDPSGGGSWSTLPPVPHPRDHVGVAIVDGRWLVVAGGRDSGTDGFFKNNIAEVDILDLTNGTWLPDGIAPPIPTPRAGCGTASLASGVLIVGGEGDGQAYATASHLTRSAEGTWAWADLAPLANARHGIGAVSCGGAAFVAGGTGKQGGGLPVFSVEALVVDGGELPTCNLTAVTPGGNGTGGGTGGVGGSSGEGAGDPACFPSDAVVDTPAGAARLADVRIGDPLRVVLPSGAIGWSPLMGWSHADPTASGAAYVRLTVGAGPSSSGGEALTGARLTLTPGHLLPVGERRTLTPAASVHVGDTVYVVGPSWAGGSNRSAAASAPCGASTGGSPDGLATTTADAVCAAAAATPATVTAVSHTTAPTGLYAPHVAATGALLVVDGVAVADTTTAVHPAVAAVGLALWRAAWAVAGGRRRDVTGGVLAGAGGIGLGGAGVRRAVTWVLGGKA